MAYQKINHHLFNYYSNAIWGNVRFLKGNKSGIINPDT